MLLFRISVMAIVLSTSLGSVVSRAHAQERQFAVHGVVVDSGGAAISGAEVSFKAESGAVVSHTGMDGSVHVNLAAGEYAVTVRARGFAVKNLVDLAVPSPSADTFRVILEIDQSQLSDGSDFGHGAGRTPTEPSELPNVIKDESTSTSLPLQQPAASKRRSIRCLYLWRCSAS